MPDQIGLALHLYHDVNHHFPPSAQWGTGSGRPQGAMHHTWLTLILPYVEQSAAYNNTDLQRRAWGQAIVSTEVSFLRCPSDGGFVTASETHNIAVTNYVGSEGYHWWPRATLPANWRGTGLPAADYSGIFTIENTVSMGNITDGTSNTVMVSYSDVNGGVKTAK